MLKQLPCDCLEFVADWQVNQKSYKVLAVISLGVDYSQCGCKYVCGHPCHCGQHLVAQTTASVATSMCVVTYATVANTL